jgi:hypothetical protein
MWTYVSSGVEPQGLNETLAEWGRDGWEIVTVTPLTLNNRETRLGWDTHVFDVTRYVVVRRRASE